MHIEEKIFSRKKPNFTHLLENGFVKRPEGYAFSQSFGDGQYLAEVLVSAIGDVAGKVLELESGDEFLPLRVDELKNETVQNVRDEYVAILRQIAQTCFTELPFLNDQSNRIASLIRERYGDQPDFPWSAFPYYGVFRHQCTRKWYGLIMNVPPVKLYAKDPAQKSRLPQAVAAKSEIEIMALKIPTVEISALDTESGIFPAYHLNAKHWITVLLENVLSDERIMELVGESYHTTLPRK